MKRYGEQQERLSYLSTSGKERKKAPGHWQIEFKFKIYSDIRCSYTIQSGKSTISLVRRKHTREKKMRLCKIYSIYKRWHHGDIKLAKPAGTQSLFNFSKWKKSRSLWICLMVTMSHQYYWDIKSTFAAWIRERIYFFWVLN